MPLDENIISEAKAVGVAFICAMCEHWADGRDQNRRTSMGLSVCTKDDCSCPIDGGDFKHYVGPLKNVKMNFCYLCGSKPTHVVSAKKQFAEKIGLCKEHVGFVKKRTVRHIKNGQSLVVAAKLVVDKHVVE
jgi:hypothetical protein